jgi:hypothetical protein
MRRTVWKQPKDFEAKPHKLLVEGRKQTKNELARQKESTRFMVVADRDARLWRNFLTSDALLQRLLDDAKVVAHFKAWNCKQRMVEGIFVSFSSKLGDCSLALLVVCRRHMLLPRLCRVYGGWLLLMPRWTKRS